MWGPELNIELSCNRDTDIVFCLRYTLHPPDASLRVCLLIESQPERLGVGRHNVTSFEYDWFIDFRFYYDSRHTRNYSSVTVSLLCRWACCPVPVFGTLVAVNDASGIDPSSFRVLCFFLRHSSQKLADHWPTTSTRASTLLKSSLIF